MGVWAELFILAGLSVFLFLRLWSMLGSKTGHFQEKGRAPFEPQNSDATDNVIPLRPKGGESLLHEGEKETVVIDLEPVTYSEEILDAIRRIRVFSPAFQVESLIKNAPKAYKMIIESFSKEDTLTLEELLSKSVLDQFFQAIKDRKSQNLTLDTQVLSIESCELVSLSLKESVARATLLFKSEHLSFTTNADGQIIDNPAKLTLRQKDSWTFERDFKDKTPKWYLVATAQQDS
ncbi:MAG TPA: Tim44/TimA family putative adaptor protein [Alphaproteobacteria bacterium]|nr:Tim44/TimA family putative adaptor protein [Alphaproteobacteria bacterium]